MILQLIIYFLNLFNYTKSKKQMITNNITTPIMNPIHNIDEHILTEYGYYIYLD
jgi:uncharacterized protein YggT (Ycf19 family)